MHTASGNTFLSKSVQMPVFSRCDPFVCPGGDTLSKLFDLSSEKRVYTKRKEFGPKGGANSFILE